MRSRIQQCVLLFVSVHMVAGPAYSAPADSNESRTENIRESSNLRKTEPSQDKSSCRVEGHWYRHGQQIVRKDPCDFCLCIDREMFCYWQPELCLSPPPLTNETSVRPTQAQNTSKAITLSPLSEESGSDMTRETSTMISATFTSEENQTTELPPATAQISTAQPTSCIVLGVEYQLGEILPRDTGSCLQCQCTDEGRIACTPKNCVSLSQDYVHDPINSLDMFDVDVF
ncbi:uncharacterized protein [Bemisia tabaci]